MAKFTDEPAKNTEAPPTLPCVCTVNDIKLIAPSDVGIIGAEPDGNKKYVLNPTVVIPEL